MKYLALLIAILVQSTVFAQVNKVTIDLDKKAITNTPQLNLNNDFTISFTGGTFPSNATEIRAIFTSGNLILPDVSVPNVSDIVAHIPANINPDCIVTIFYTIGHSKQIITSFRILRGGQVADITPISTDPVYYHSLLMPSNAALAKSFKDFQVVVYDPKTNTYKIYRDDGEHETLRFRLFSSKHNDGVLFFIKNFNMLKYDVTLSNTFNTRFTDIPDLLTSISSVVSSGLTAANGAGTIDDDIYKIVQLNSDLTKLLNTDVLDFDRARKDIMTNVQLNFGGANGLISISENYNAHKKAIIDAALPIAAGKPYSADNFNADYQMQFHLPIPPDSLVTETISLYNTLLTTDFNFQGNVPQLQNADELQYTLNIAGKTGSTNANISVNSQPITIPIIGGIKMDFSTGLYFSNRKNENYTLVKNKTDTTMSTITQEGGFNSGTVGVNALLHIYKRVSPWLNPSFTFGLGKALDQNYSVLLGGSLLIGHQNRIALSYGWDFANVKALSYSNNTPTVATGTTLNYYNKFKQGYFFSFTYSFGVTQATQAASSATPASSTTPAATSAATTPAGSGGGGGGKGKKS